MLFLLVFFLGANSHSARADESAGQRAYASGDYATALRAWRKLAESGNAEAERGMGLLYATGHGVRQDFAQALRWYKRAGFRGDAQAMYDVGAIYDTGHGVPVDTGRATWWYRRAAKHGFAPAARRLAELNQGDNGVPKSQADADHHADAAAGHGDAAAHDQRNPAPVTAEQLPLPPQPVPPPAEAPAIDPALARAQKLILAHGVTGIDSSAVVALRKAATHGDAVAQYDLGFCYQNGFGVAADQMQAYVWYHRAVNGTAPAALHRAAATQARTLEAQLDPSQLGAAKALLNAPPQ